jgi:tetratricopeptide (TPR) repeat protein
VLEEQKEYAAAITKYQKAIDLDPKDGSAYDNWGNVLRKQKKYDAAITKFQKAINLDPKDGSAYNDWGIALRASFTMLRSSVRKSTAKLKSLPKAESFCRLNNMTPEWQRLSNNILR